MTKNYIFEIELKEEDYEILKEWGYYFEMNIKDSIEEDANSLRKALEKRKLK